LARELLSRIGEPRARLLPSSANTRQHHETFNNLSFPPLAAPSVRIDAYANSKNVVAIGRNSQALSVIFRRLKAVM
jgi:hypothetical protein